jgi:hypothetical protein
VTSRDTARLLQELVARLRALLAVQIGAGAMLLASGPPTPAEGPLLRPIAIGLVASLVPAFLLLPPALVLASALAWRRHRKRVPSPLKGERWRFARFATCPTAATSKGMVALSDERVVFVASGPRWREQSFAIELSDIIRSRLVTRCAWHLGLDYEVVLVRENAPVVRFRLLGAGTLRGLVEDAVNHFATRHLGNLVLCALSHMVKASVTASLMLRRERAQVTRRSVASSVGT